MRYPLLMSQPVLRGVPRFPARSIVNKSSYSNGKGDAMDQMGASLGAMASGRGALMGQLALGGGLVAFFANQTAFFTDAGVTHVYQNSLSGELTVYFEPGVHMRMPFFSTLTAYKQILSVTFGDGDLGPRAVPVRFADTYSGSIPISFRFRLPTGDTEKMLLVHREFRSERNLLENLLERNAKTVTVATASQYTGEEFFQGGFTQVRSPVPPPYSPVH